MDKNEIIAIINDLIENVTGQLPANLDVSEENVKFKDKTVVVYLCKATLNNGEVIITQFVPPESIKDIAESVGSSLEAVMRTLGVGKDKSAQGMMFPKNPLDMFFPTDPKAYEEQKSKEEKTVQEHYQRMGLIEDFNDHYPFLKVFGDLVFFFIDDIEASDFIFVCQIMDSLVEKLGDPNNFRVCRTKDGELSGKYKVVQNGGCCKVYDKKFTNPKTKNSFMIGCNHDHYEKRNSKIF